MNIITNSIYENFKPLEKKLTGWNGTEPIFRELVARIRPAHIIEVGTWRGQSAITMARAVKDLSIGSKVTCVDTWLGSVEFWTSHKKTPERDLMLRHGYPQAYFQFLSNVVHEGLQDVILPFPTTSFIAARCFKKEGVSAQLIYIDGNHEYEDVVRDCVEYWGILEPGGVLFGDDWTWPSVARAVQDFAKQIRVPISRVGREFWVFQKPITEFATEEAIGPV